jgi:hypothetical protein
MNISASPNELPAGMISMTFSLPCGDRNASLTWP